MEKEQAQIIKEAEEFAKKRYLDKITKVRKSKLVKWLKGVGGPLVVGVTIYGFPEKVKAKGALGAVVDVALAIEDVHYPRKRCAKPARCHQFV
jgi:hypothetical protein